MNGLDALLKLLAWHREICDQSMRKFLRSLIYKHQSRAPKHGFWLMRGDQPATSAGARLFAGSPIPAFFTTPQREVKKSILSLLYFKLVA